MKDFWLPHRKKRISHLKLRSFAQNVVTVQHLLIVFGFIWLEEYVPFHEKKEKQRLNFLTDIKGRNKCRVYDILFFVDVLKVLEICDY